MAYQNIWTIICLVLCLSRSHIYARERNNRTLNNRPSSIDSSRGPSASSSKTAIGNSTGSIQNLTTITENGLYGSSTTFSTISAFHQPNLGEINFVEKFNATERLLELECQSLLTNHIYEQGECAGAPDVETYMKLWKPRYACLDRCGKRPGLETPLDCACDDLCLVYKDCCRDMSNTCPEMYTRGQALYPHLLKAEPVCLNYEIPSAVIADNSYHLVHEEPLTTSTLEPPTPQNKNLPEGSHTFRPRTLEFYFGYLSEFQVADVTFGVVFNTFAAFLSSNVPQSKFFFIPKIAILRCSDEFMTRGRLISLVEYLASCYIDDVRNVLTRLHRSCRHHSVVSCRCRDGQIISDRALDSCQSGYNTARLFARTNQNAIPAPYELVNDRAKRCMLVEGRTVRKDPSFEMFKEEVSLKISITPVMGFRPTDDSVQDASAEGTNGPDELYRGDKADNMLKRDAIEYIVEPSDTLERRLLCPRLKSFLSDCQVLECTPGAILSATSLSPWKFSGRACMLPVAVGAVRPGANLTLPVCTCMRIQLAIFRMGIWNVFMKQNSPGSCSMGLEIHSKVKTTKLTTDNYRFPDAGSNQYRPMFHTQGKATSLFSHERLQELLLQTESYCPEETFDQLQICFDDEANFHGRGDKPPFRDTLCITLAASHFRFQENSAVSALPKVSLVFHILNFLLQFLF